MAGIENHARAALNHLRSAEEAIAGGAEMTAGIQLGRAIERLNQIPEDD